MPQLFRRRANTIARASLISFFLLLGAAGWALYAVYQSPYTTGVKVALPQPVPFSHQHHVDGLGLDCRYCHSSVETSSFAGLPSTDTCMTCHSQVWNDAPMLAPVRASLRNNTPLEWNRVHDMPDFVYFDHSIHVQKGIGCSTCHGPVHKMPLTWKEHSMFMKWCLECHRRPENFVRPIEEVFNMDWTPPKDQPEQGARLVQEYGINTRHLTDCSICHR